MNSVAISGPKLASPPDPSRWRAALSLLLLLAPLYGARLGVSPLFDRDEAFYTESARQMVARGNWITPWFNDQPRFDKPIFYYWLQIGSRLALGESELAARLPSAIATLLLVLGTFVALDGLVGTSAAFTSALLLGIGGETVALAHLAIPDATFALFLTACWLITFAWIEGIVEAERGAHALGVFLALAILTKGIVAPVLLVLTVAAYRVWSGPLRAKLGKAALARLAVVATVLTAPWFVVETAIEGWEFPKTFFFKHHLERFVSGLPGHTKPWWYFASNIPFLFLPAVLYLPAAWKRARAERVEDTAGRVVEARLARFALSWFAVVVVFFSLSRGKLANYVFPALPAVAVLGGLAVEARWSGRERTGRTERAAALLFALAALACVAISGPSGDWIRAHLNEENREQLMDLGWQPLVPAVVFAGVALMAWAAIRAAATRHALAILAYGFILLAAVGGILVMPELGERSYGATREVARRMGVALAESPGRIVQYRLFRPTMVHYARHPIVVTKDRAILEAELAKPGPLYVATLRKHLERESIPGLVELGGTARVVVLANDTAARAYRSASH